MCVVLQLSGLALVVLGAVLLTDVPHVLLSRLLGPSYMPTHPLFYYVALGLMGMGLLVCATGVLGFWATCLHSHCLLALVGTGTCCCSTTGAHSRWITQICVVTCQPDPEKGRTVVHAGFLLEEVFTSVSKTGESVTDYRFLLWVKYHRQ